MTWPARALALPSAFVVVVSLLGSSAPLQEGKPAPAAPAAASPTTATSTATAEKLEPFVIEYYYKAKWGHAAEFFRLFKKNYLPLLREMERQGRILSIALHSPRHHATEEGRWDWRLTVTWRDVVTAHDDHHPKELIAKLFPDVALHQQEEQQRFELLIAHWDVLVEEEELEEVKEAVK